MSGCGTGCKGYAWKNTGQSAGNSSAEGWGYCGFRGNGNHAELLFQEAGNQGDVQASYDSDLLSKQHHQCGKKCHDVAYRAGAKKVYIEEEPKVAAVGAGLDIGKPSGCMVLDIGGGTTDVAVISLGEIVSSTSLKIAGDTLDRDIIKFVKENKKLLIGDRTAEEVKKQIGTAWKGSMHETIEVSGRDLVTGLPTTITLSSEEIQGSMAESLQDVVRACKTVLEQTPPELASDIVTRGIVLTGGGALLHGIDELLRNELHIPVYVAENALRCVAEGTGILLENLHLVQ